MLHALKDESGMSFGQLAARAGWSRSGLHKATKDGPTMPARQVVNDFIIACRVSPVQVDLVMAMWDKISAAIRAEEELAAQRTVLPTAKHGDADPAPLDTGPVPMTLTAASTSGALENLLKELRKAHAGSSPRGDFYVQVVQHQATDRNRTTLVDLLHFILLDQRRTQRALVLMAAAGSLALLQIALVVILASRVPSGGLWLGVTVAAGVTFVATKHLARRLSQSVRARRQYELGAAMPVAAPPRRRERRHRSTVADTQKIGDQLPQ